MQIDHPISEKQIEKIQIPKKIKKNKQKQQTLIHQLDIIYQGQINKSHHKQGFGILQTLEFEMYMGFFKNNKADGMGLILYPFGEKIYAHFSKDKMSGLILADDKKFLRLGIIDKMMFKGLSYEYTYSTQTWKIITFQKGIPVSMINEEQCSIYSNLPSFLHTDHTTLNHLLRYLAKDYFLEQNCEVRRVNNTENVKTLNQLYVHKKSPAVTYYGLQDKEGYQGLGFLIDDLKGFVFEGGFYNNGLLNGYSFKSSSSSHFFEMGLYQKGEKQGYFYRQKNQQVSFCEYKGNKFMGFSGVQLEYLRKKQKIYNYSQKDFLSLKNTLNLKYFFEIFIEPEVRSYQKGSKQFSKEEKNNHQFLQFSIPNIEQIKIKTSLQIIKEKAKIYNNNIENNQPEQSQAQNQEKTPQRYILQDQVAEEVSPFEIGNLQKIINHSDPENISPSKLKRIH